MAQPSEFDVYLKLSVNLLGTTRDVLVPYPQNPITAENRQDAVSQAAIELAGTFGDEQASGTYIVEPSGQATTVTVSSFSRVPVLS